MTTSQSHLADALQTLRPIADSPSTRSRIATCEVDQSFPTRFSSEYLGWCNLVEPHPDTTAVERPDFVLRDVTGTDDVLKTQIVYSENNGRIEAVAILAPSRIKGRKYSVLAGQLELRTYRLVGSRVFGDANQEVHDRVLDAAVAIASKSRAEAFNLEDLPVDSHAWTYFTGKHSAWAPAGTQMHHQIRFPSEASEYWEKFNSKTRKKFRKRIRQFGKHHMRVFTRPSDVADFLQDASTISKYSWKAGEFGLRIEGTAREEQMMTTLAMADAFRSYILYHDGQPAAFELGYQHRGQYLAEDAAYDSRLAAKSPGQVLQLLVLQDLCERSTPAVYDFGFGDGEYKTLFSNSTYPSANMLVPLPGLSAKLKSMRLKSAVYTERVLRRILNQTGDTLLRLRQRRRTTSA